MKGANALEGCSLLFREEEPRCLKMYGCCVYNVCIKDLGLLNSWKKLENRRDIVDFNKIFTSWKVIRLKKKKKKNEK